MKVSYLFGISRTARLSIRTKLPKLFPYGRQIEIKGNKVESDIWFMIKLSREKG